MVNQPSLYESLKFYCLFVCQAYYSHTELHHLGRYTLWPVLHRTREYYHDVLTSCSTASVGCSPKNMWVGLFWQCSTVLSTSLGISFFPRRFILNETILFWLTCIIPNHLSCLFVFFLYPPYNSGRVLWFHVGYLCVCPSVIRPSVHIWFLDDNLSKHQWIFTKLGMCIDIVAFWFGFANGKILAYFNGVTCLRQAYIFVSRR